MSSTIERNRIHRKEKKSIEPNRNPVPRVLSYPPYGTREAERCSVGRVTERSIFELVICVKQALKIHNQILESRVTSARSVARVFFVTNSAEIASNALWIVSFKYVVKGYQECRFDVKDGEVFKVLKKIGEKGCAFCFALIFSCYLKKTKRFDMQFHLTVVSTFLKPCLKDHGDSSCRLLESMYRSALFGGL